MEVSIERAAVIGSGVMGSAVAAHLANAGIPTLLLDIVPPDDAGVKGDKDSAEYRNAFAAAGLKRALKSKPAAFFHKERAGLISIGNLEDDLPRLADADWIIEAVVERLDIKQKVFESIAPHLKPEAILSTNTSGLSVTEMASVLPEQLRPRFLGTHFFNPPRYLRLLEMIPHPGTDPAVLEAMTAFGEEIVGKGVVVAKDTPNFIANRIGGFTVMSCIRAMAEGGYTVEEIDALTGPLLGRPKSATFRTADIVGLDILVHAAQTVYDRATDDPYRDYFDPPEFVKRMLKENRLGEKSGEGFYKKIKKDGKSQILTLDLETFEYREQQKAKFSSVDAARQLDGLGNRIAAVMKARDRAGEYTWKTMSEVLLYCAMLADEIADDIVAIDRAMRWGFGWKLGPFELWDAIGVEMLAERMKEDGHKLPPIVESVLSTPEKTFYKRGDDYALFYIKAGEHRPADESPKNINLEALKARGGLVKKNAGASLVDMGDGVLCLEFHSKMNAIGSDIISLMHKAIKEVEENHAALVIGNHGSNFSVGANIMLLLLEAQDGNWEEIDLMVRAFQKATMALKYSKKPVVAAPFGMTLGGGCEVVLGSSAAYASAETYIGLVEVGVGLIPAGGGCKEMLMRNLEGRPEVDGLDPFPYARAAFEAIGMARVATSALEAKHMKILRRSDGIAMNPDRQLYYAKQMALGLARQGYRPPVASTEVPVAGQSGIGAITAQLYNMKEGGYISEYDAYIGSQLARILCGGEVPSGTMVTEKYLLELERETFLRLCGQRKTQERIQHMLKKGKPLRN